MKHLLQLWRRRAAAGVAGGLLGLVTAMEAVAVAIGISDPAVVLRDGAGSAWEQCEVELGGFADGFEPTAANAHQWETYWLPAGRGYAGRSAATGEVSAEIELADNSVLGPGQRLYLWVFNGKARSGTEWGLFTDEGWTVPVATPLALGRTLRFTARSRAVYGNYAGGALTATTATTDLGIAAQPGSRRVRGGSPVTLTAQASGVGPFSYQWLRNGVVIEGATAPSLTIPAMQVGDSGYYTVVIANGVTAITSTEAAVALAEARSRLVNLSVRATAGVGEDILIAGFVNAGGDNQFLLRAPTLAAYGVAGALADPRVDLHDAGGTWLGGNDNWATGSLELAVVTELVHAFALPVGGKDAATVARLQAGAYTVHVAGVGGTTGVALAEVYDASVEETGRLLNVSGRGQVGTGDAIVIGGFVISGETPKTMLLRGAGPALATLGVGAALSDPRLALYRMDGQPVQIASNDDWGGDAATGAQIATAAARVGAFSFASGSGDAALLVALEPGAYTVHLAGVDDATGVGLLEIYDADTD